MAIESDYREQVVSQHQEILATLQTLTATLTSLTEAARSSDTATAAALNKMSEALMSALKVPVAAVMVSAVSFLFYSGRIQESTWIIFCLVSMFPWFGDSIRTVLQIVRIGPNEKIVSSAKLIAVFSAALSLYFNH